MTVRALVAGVGMIPFTKPGRSAGWDVMGEQAARAALQDARLAYGDIQQAFVGYVYGDSTAGQSVLYKLGLTGIPVINVNNNCSTGSTALFLARQLIELGGADCVLALGFEEMVPGALGLVFKDRRPTMEMSTNAVLAIQGADPNAPGPAQQFGGAGREYQERYGAKDETFAMISVKARRHAANNPHAIFKEPVTLEEVMASKHLYGPVTRLQACPPTCGAAAAILVSDAFAKKHGMDVKVAIKAQALTTDLPGAFSSQSMMKVIGYDMTKAAADRVYEQAGVGPDEVQVIELHDCFTPNELISYEALGLCAPGGAEAYIRAGLNTYGGKHVINPSGGLLSKGHPLGATGLAQCYELTHQVRGTAGARQVDNVQHALQHNLGLGGACVVTMYARAD